jgi:hypothetical protein
MRFLSSPETPPALLSRDRSYSEPVLVLDVRPGPAAGVSGARGC